MQDEKSEDVAGQTRREMLAGVGGVCLFGTSVVSADGPKPLSQEEIKRRLTERYDKRAGVQGARIIGRLWGRKQKEGMSHTEYHNEVTERLLAHQATKEIAQDVRSSSQRIKKELESRVSKSEQSDADTLTTTAVNSGSFEITAVDTEEDQSGLGNATAEVVNTDEIAPSPPDKAKVFADVPLYGTAEATVRLYNLFYPENTGSYKFTTNYFRKGKVEVSGGGISSIYIDENGTETVKEVESLIGDVNGTESRAASFELKEGVGYFVGVEYYCNTLNASSFSLSDFRTNSRRFEPNPNGPKRPELTWEYFG